MMGWGASTRPTGNGPSTPRPQQYALSFRRITNDAGSRPVLEGKQIDSFRVALEHCRYELRPGARAAARAASTARVGYRDVASATNRLTLIAAIIPAHAVTTHTVFCLKTRLAEPAQGRVTAGAIDSHDLSAVS